MNGERLSRSKTNVKKYCGLQNVVGNGFEMFLSQKYLPKLNLCNAIAQS